MHTLPRYPVLARTTDTWERATPRLWSIVGSSGWCCPGRRQVVCVPGWRWGAVQLPVPSAWCSAEVTDAGPKGECRVRSGPTRRGADPWMRASDGGRGRPGEGRSILSSPEARRPWWPPVVEDPGPALTGHRPGRSGHRVEGVAAQLQVVGVAQYASTRSWRGSTPYIAAGSPSSTDACRAASRCPRGGGATGRRRDRQWAAWCVPRPPEPRARQRRAATGLGVGHRSGGVRGPAPCGRSRHPWRSGRCSGAWRGPRWVRGRIAQGLLPAEGGAMRGCG